MLVVIYTESREWEIHEIVLTLLICFLVALSLLLIKAFMHSMIAFFFASSHSAECAQSEARNLSLCRP